MSNNHNKEGSRWWEFYFVRYLIGSIIGAVIISYVIHHNSVLIGKELTIEGLLGWSKSLDKSYFIWLIVGFGYCYIASAPILVLHACRFILKTKETSVLTIFFSFLMLLLIVIYLLFALDIVTEGLNWISRVLVLLITVVQTVFIVLGLKRERLSSFYDSLSRKRMKERNSKTRYDYLNSYKHLREHGNAFLIVVMELILGFALINCSTIPEVVSLIVIWIFPGSAVWLIGTFLEFNLDNLGGN